MRFLPFIAVLFLLSCLPPKGKTFNHPPSLSYENIPKPFKGTLYLSNFRLPFKYYPKEDKIVFPLLYLGFVSYKNKTLRLGKHSITFPLELWRILKHRLVKRGFLLYSEGNKYRIEGQIGGVFVRLYTTKAFIPLKARLCDEGGCTSVLYKTPWVKVKALGAELNFKLKEDY